MTEDEFYHYLDGAVEALKTKQAHLQAAYNMGSHARWWFDQAAGLLKFYNDPQQAIDLEAEVLVLGTYAPESQTWKWGWANPTLSETQRNASSSLQNLAAVTAVDFFAQEGEFTLESGMEWELAAIAVAHLNLLGVYRAPSSLGKHMTFLGIVQLTRS